MQHAKQELNVDSALNILCTFECVYECESVFYVISLFGYLGLRKHIFNVQ